MPAARGDPRNTVRPVRRTPLSRRFGLPIGIKLRGVYVKLVSEFVESELVGPRAGNDQRREVGESPTSFTRNVARILLVGVFKNFVDVDGSVRTEPKRRGLEGYHAGRNLCGEVL